MVEWKKVSLRESTVLKIKQLKGNDGVDTFIEKVINKHGRENKEITQLKIEIERLKENNGHNNGDSEEILRVRKENETLKLENETLRALEEDHNADSIEEASKCDFFTIGEKLGTVFCGKDWRLKGKIYTVPIHFCRRCGDWTQSCADDDESED